MRTEDEGGAERLQYSTEGELVGKLVKTPKNQWALLLEPDFMLVVIPETGRTRIWGGKHRKLIEFENGQQTTHTP